MPVWAMLKNSVEDFHRILDSKSEFKNSDMVRSPEMERRVKTFQQWYEKAKRSRPISTFNLPLSTFKI